MNEIAKNLTKWANDPRIPFTKMTLWRAVSDGRLKATRPAGGKMWIVKESDMMSFLNGGSNE